MSNNKGHTRKQSSCAILRVRTLKHVQNLQHKHQVIFKPELWVRKERKSSLVDERVTGRVNQEYRDKDKGRDSPGL